MIRLTKKIQRVFVVTHPEYGQPQKTHRHTRGRIQFTSAREKCARFREIFVLLQFQKSQLKMRLPIFGEFAELFTAHVAIKIVFPRFGCGVGCKSKMVDKEVRPAQRAVHLSNPRPHAFMDAAHEEDFRRAAKQTGCFRAR